MFVTDIFADILIRASTKASIAVLVCLFIGPITSLTILPIPHQHAKQYKTNYDGLLLLHCPTITKEI